MGMIDRVIHFSRTFKEIRGDSQDNMRALRYAARLFRRKFKIFCRQSAAALAAPRRRASLALLAEQLSAGDPALCIRISGGIGDNIVIARYVRDLLAETPGAVFDIYCSTPSSAAWVFAAVPGFRNVYPDILYERNVSFYDVGLKLNQFAVVDSDQVKWNRLHKHRALMARLECTLKSRAELDLLIQKHPYMDNYLGSIAYFRNVSRRNFLHHMSGIEYLGDRLALPFSDDAVKQFGLDNVPYILVHNGFDTNFVIAGDTATKCYPHFAQVIAQLKLQMPQLRIVQIGAGTSQAIAGVDLCIVDKTSLQQAAGLIAGAEMLLDNEGGLVHVAASLGTKACVIFGPTPSRFFGYPDNINIDPQFCGDCWWIKESWMDRCVRGFSEPRCMTGQSPEAVLAHILPVLANPTQRLAAA